MRVLIDGRIRGESVEVVWDDGVVSGDMELVRRARLMSIAARHPCDEGKAAEFISALERAAGERLEVTIWPSAKLTEESIVATALTGFDQGKLILD